MTYRVSLIRTAFLRERYAKGEKAREEYLDKRNDLGKRDA